MNETSAGPTPNGTPSVVSLEAHATRRRRSLAAAWKTLKFIVTFALKVTAGVLRPGAGTLARWTTASEPSSAPSAWPLAPVTQIRPFTAALPVDVSGTYKVRGYHLERLGACAKG